MLAKVQKWGNSLAVRIPRSFARDTRLASGSAVDISLQEGKLVLTPAPRQHYRLEDLLRGVTKKNRHGEVQTGGAVGQEVW